MIPLESRRTSARDSLLLLGCGNGDNERRLPYNSHVSIDGESTQRTRPSPVIIICCVPPTMTNNIQIKTKYNKKWWW